MDHNLAERKRFGEQLRRLRESRGLSQAELAARAGLTKEHYGVIERGGANVTLDSIFNITRVLSVQLELTPPRGGATAPLVLPTDEEFELIEHATDAMQQATEVLKRYKPPPAVAKRLPRPRR